MPAKKRIRNKNSLDLRSATRLRKEKQQPALIKEYEKMMVGFVPASVPGLMQEWTLPGDFIKKLSRYDENTFTIASTSTSITQLT